MAMSFRRLLLVCPIITAAIAIALPRPAYGCSCRRPAPPDMALVESTAVFSGTVVSIDAPHPAYLTITFDTATTWKGVLSQTTTLQTAANTAACGYPFVLGETYLVYARQRPTQQTGAQLRTTQCDRTSPLSQAIQDIAILDAMP